MPVTISTVGGTSSKQKLITFVHKCQYFKLRGTHCSLSPKNIQQQQKVLLRTNISFQLPKTNSHLQTEHLNGV